MGTHHRRVLGPRIRQRRRRRHSVTVVVGRLSAFNRFGAGIPFCTL